MFHRRKSSRRPFVKRSLGMESLECRAMLAGDVMVEVRKTADIVIVGDGAANEFRVTANELSEIVVEGLNGTNIVFGGSSASSQVVANAIDRDLIIDSGGGNDIVEVAGVAVVRSMRIVLRNGLDQLTVDDSSVARNFSVNGGGGRDVIGLIDTFVSGGTNVIGGNGADLLVLDTLASTASINVFAGADNDTVEISNAIASESIATVNLGEGRNRLNLTDSMLGAFSTTGGSGDDEWVATDSTFNGLVSVEFGDGIDIFSAESTTFERDLFVQLGNGSETFPEFVELTTSMFNGSAEFRGAAGEQELMADRSTFRLWFRTFFGGGDDTVSLVGSTVNVTVTQLGSGVDRLTTSDTRFSGPVLIRMGGGIDQFSSGATDLFLSAVTIDGGRGNHDVATVGQTFLLGALLTGFETTILAPNTPLEA